ncbi:hypothetical protein D3C72_1646650 [compost metagenome]
MPNARTMFCMRIAALWRDSLTKAGIFRKSSSISATSAVSMAVSVPATAMAKPISARASAGASLIPSPTMPTRWPWAYRVSMLLSLSAGSRLPSARSIPTTVAMAWAVCGLSPVSMTVLMPSSCSSAMAWRLLSLTVSATANSANGPERSSSSTTVLPWRSSASSWASSSGEHSPSSSTRRWLPRW